MNLTIYHNPRCSKSRQTLELIRSRGVEPTIVEYLKSMPDADELLNLARALSMDVAGMLRKGEEAYVNADSRPDDGDNEAMARWLAAHPGVLERPIVLDVDRGIAVIGRPPENVENLLG